MRRVLGHIAHPWPTASGSTDVMSQPTAEDFITTHPSGAPTSIRLPNEPQKTLEVLAGPPGDKHLQDKELLTDILSAIIKEAYDAGAKNLMAELMQRRPKPPVSHDSKELARLATEYEKFAQWLLQQPIKR